MKYKFVCVLIALTCASLHAHADTVITKDGSTLHGIITLIDRGEIHIDTKYAGKLKLKQDEVLSFESEAPRVVRLDSGTQLLGSVIASSDDKLKIQSEEGTLETSTGKVAASWAPDAVDPEIQRNRRKWRHDLAVNLIGKEGNTDKSYLGVDLDMRLKGPDDELRFTIEYEQGEENGNETDDRALGRADYERFSKNKVGWYVHNALETDKVSDIYLRSTTGGGASYRFINNDQQTLVVRSGLGYRFTDFYSDGRKSDSSVTLETGLEHSYKYQDFCYIENKLYYSPALDDFSNYRVTHDSSLKIPVGNGESFWIRMGIKHEYESQTSAEEKLDTSYYTKLIYSWK